MRTRVALWGLVSIVCATAAAGCLGGGEHTPVTRYALEPQVTVEPGPSCGQSLAVRMLTAAQPYNQPIVYRTSAYELGTYAFSEWAEPPRDTVTRTLIDALAASGRFSDVGYSLDQSRPDLLITGELRRFDVVQDAEPWQAVCEVRLELREALTKTLIWQDTLIATVPTAGSQVSTVPPAMSQALSEVVTNAVKAIGTKL